jgi:hypothetical protein
MLPIIKMETKQYQMMKVGALKVRSSILTMKRDAKRSIWKQKLLASETQSILSLKMWQTLLKTLTSFKKLLTSLLELIP